MIAQDKLLYVPGGVRVHRDVIPSASIFYPCYDPWGIFRALTRAGGTALYELMARGHGVIPPSDETCFFPVPGLLFRSVRVSEVSGKFQKVAPLQR